MADVVEILIPGIKGDKGTPGDKGDSGEAGTPGLQGEGTQGTEGPAYGFDDAGAIVPSIAYDNDGRVLYYPAPDGRMRVADAQGTLSSETQGRSGPSAGWFTDEDTEPATSVMLDEAGRALFLTSSLGRLLFASSDRLWRDDPVTTTGPSAGWLTEESTTPVESIEVDRNGRALSARRSDGALLQPVGDGTWTTLFPAAAETTGPSAGFMGDEADTLAIRVVTDSEGRALEALAEGAIYGGVKLIASPSGLARQDSPRDVANLTRTGTTIAVPPVRIGSLDTNPAVVASAAPASSAVNDEAQTIRFNDAAWLAYQYVSDVVVTRVSDSAVLVEGTDYALDTKRGVITGLVNTANFSATVDYTGYAQRAELISVDPQTGAISITAGDENERIPSMLEPALPAGHVALFRVNRTVDGAELAPVHLFTDDLRRDRADVIAAEIEKQRRRARRIRHLVATKVATAGTLKWAGYGDSITAMGNGTTAQVNTLPNGPRDVINYFQLYDTAARTLIPQYDLGDGLGTVHTREGWNWYACKWLATEYGLTYSYRNWGIGGTDSSNTTNGAGFHNQGQATRLAALIADACDVVLFAPGMNELGATFTYANVLGIGQAILAAGQELILCAPARPNQRWRDRLVQWRETCRQVEQAADALGVPFIQTARIYEPWNLGAIGIAENEICDATIQNHPGRKELNAIGRLVTEIL